MATTAVKHDDLRKQLVILMKQKFPGSLYYDHNAMSITVNENNWSFIIDCYFSVSHGPLMTDHRIPFRLPLIKNDSGIIFGQGNVYEIAYGFVTTFTSMARGEMNYYNSKYNSDEMEQTSSRRRREEDD
jgi:hypothetical protein